MLMSSNIAGSRLTAQPCLARNQHPSTLDGAIPCLDTIWIYCRWDYGYQITGMANRTVIVDNNTWNNTHIATVGRAMASNEEDAYEIMQVWL